MVVRRKPVHDAQQAIEFHETRAAVRPSRIHVEGAVARHEVDVAVGVCGYSLAGLPDAAAPPIGGIVVHRDLLKRVRVVTDHPAVIWSLISMRRKCEVDEAVREEQAHSIEVPERVETDAASGTVVASAWHAAPNHDGAAQSF